MLTVSIKFAGSKKKFIGSKNVKRFVIIFMYYQKIKMEKEK